MIRKIAVVILFLTAALPFLLAVLFWGKQQYVRHQMKENLEKQNLISLTLNSKTLHWYKKDKELLIENKFFDVKTIQVISNDEVLVTGLFDHKEKELHDELVKNLKNESGNQSQPFQLAKLFFSMNAILNENEHGQFEINNEISFLTCNHCIYPQLFFPVISPPPQFAS